MSHCDVIVAPAEWECTTWEQTARSRKREIHRNSTQRVTKDGGKTHQCPHVFHTSRIKDQNPLISGIDLSPIPVTSVVKSNLTSSFYQNLSKL